MKLNFDIFNLFENAIKKCPRIFNNHTNRLYNEVDYFRAYLDFLNNSIYFSRFKFVSKDILIKGKYLNEKVNRWNKFNIFNIMIKDLLTEYFKVINPKNLIFIAIDSQFISNKFMNSSSIGRNKFYKNKQGLKLSALVDNNGVPLSLILNTGNKSDNILLKETVSNMFDISSIKKYKSFLADSGYDSKSNIEYITNYNLKPFILKNNRNSKIKVKTFTKKQMKFYTKRVIIEHYFARKEVIIPRSYKIYDKKISNFYGMFLLSGIILTFNVINKL